MAGVAAVWCGINSRSKEEVERDGVCKAFLAIFEYFDKNCEGLVSLDDVAAYLLDCGVELSQQEREHSHWSRFLQILRYNWLGS